MGVHIKQTEPPSPWQNAAKLAIRELKKGAGCNAARAKSPKKLWDHALELESYILSNTVVMLPGQRVLRNYGTTPSSWNHIFFLTLLPHIPNSMGKFQKRSCPVKPQISLLLLRLGGTSRSSTMTRYRGTLSTRRSLCDGLGL